MLPGGTLTFLFTDIEGSTRLWEDDAEAMARVLARHDRLLRSAIEVHGGRVFKTVGDAFHAVFERAGDAVAAAAAAQRGLAGEAWERPGSIRVRMAIHTGVAEVRDEDYFGPTLNRTARILAIGHGGQTLLSGATAELVEDGLPPLSSLRDLGTRRLRDLERPERVFQLDIDGLPIDFPPLRSVDDVTNNLPVQLTSFVGREDVLDDVRSALAGGRLTTIVGVGGAGKTRLAIEAAAAPIEPFPDGVFFVDLAPIADAELVPQAIAEALGVREVAGTAVGSTLLRHLRDRRALIVLDNCEQVVEACARQADLLLRIAPGLTILATSREPLGTAGESLIRIPALRETEAIRLFAERAAAVAPGFALSAANTEAVAEIGRRLDGIPLAIELAAARTASLSPVEIAARLDDRFRLLTTGSRTAMPRQQTLEALVGWSHDLLSDQERVMFRRLAVFAGGFTLEACEAVCAGDGPAGVLDPAAVLEILAALVAKSLVIADPGPTTRYRMLETIRAFALERLIDSGEEAALRRRHLGWCLELCRRAEPELVGADQRSWFDRLAAEHDNVRAALTWGLEHSPSEMLEIAKSLYWFWQTRGYPTEGRGWLEAGLGTPAATDDSLRQAALLGAGSLAWVTGDYATARRELAESADIADRIGDARARSIALTILAQSMVFEGDIASARLIAAKAIALAREVGDPFVLGRSLGTLADAARHEGRDEETVRHAAEAIAAFEQVGMEEGIAFNLFYQSHGLRRVDRPRARQLLARAIGLFHKLDHPYGLSMAVLLALELGRPTPEDKARLLGAIDVLLERAGFVDTTVGRRARVRKRALRALGQSRLEDLVAEGSSLEPAAVVALATRTIDGGRPAEGPVIRPTRRSRMIAP